MTDVEKALLEACYRADILDLLDDVECHFGNMILKGGLSGEDDEYKVWMAVQEVLELHHPGWKGRK